MKRSIMVLSVLCVNVIFSQYLHAQLGALPPNAKSGECYAKHLVPAQYETTIIELPYYIGDDFERVELDIIEVKLQEARTKWVKSEETDTWELVKQEGVYEEYQVVKDTTKNKDYVLIQVEMEKLVETGGFSEWIEIVCAQKITPSLIIKIQTKLKEKGFLQNCMKGKYCIDTANALKKYQTVHNLIIGQITPETLESLGIKI